MPGWRERLPNEPQSFATSMKRFNRYAYIVSHDLRAPLVNIMGFHQRAGSPQAGDPGRWRANVYVTKPVNYENFANAIGNSGFSFRSCGSRRMVRHENTLRAVH